MKLYHIDPLLDKLNCPNPLRDSLMFAYLILTEKHLIHIKFLIQYITCLFHSFIFFFLSFIDAPIHMMHVRVQDMHTMHATNAM